MPFTFKEWPMALPLSYISNYPATTIETSKTPKTQCMWSKSAPPSQWLELWSPPCSGHSPVDCHSCLNLSGSFPQRPRIHICHSDFLMPWILSISLQHCLWNSVSPTLNSNHSPKSSSRLLLRGLLSSNHAILNPLRVCSSIFSSKFALLTSYSLIWTISIISYLSYGYQFILYRMIYHVCL